MILIGLGANLPSKHGQPEQTLQAAYAAIEARGMPVVARSRIWLSAPVPQSDQPWYRNSVISIETDQEPAQVLRLLKQVERSFGRAEAVKNAARVLDLDLLSFHDLVLDDVDFQIQIPHPRMHERGFVLHPLKEIEPEWRHPLWPDKSVDDWISYLPKSQKIRPLEDVSA